MQNKILNILFIILIIAILAWLGFYLIGDRNILQESSNFNNNEVNQENSNQSELFKSYIKANINDLSPEPAILGGTFYVNEIDFLGDKRALVNYEDGHIALETIIGFDVINDEIIIKSFEIVPEEAINQENDSDTESICVDQCGNGICEDTVCMGKGCPCAETKQNCSTDCS